MRTVTPPSSHGLGQRHCRLEQSDSEPLEAVAAAVAGALAVAADLVDDGCSACRLRATASSACWSRCGSGGALVRLLPEELVEVDLLAPYCSSLAARFLVASDNAFEDDGMPHRAIASSRPFSPIRTIGAG